MENILPLDKDELEERAMDMPISDFEIDGDTAVIYADKKDFITVQKALEAFHYHMPEADIQFIPENMVKLDEEGKNKLYGLLDALEDDEDVDHVWHNLSN